MLELEEVSHVAEQHCSLHGAVATYMVAEAAAHRNVTSSFFDL